MKTQDIHALRLIGISKTQRAAFNGGYVFVGMKTETHQVTKAADAFAFPAGADGVRCVFHHAQSFAFGKLVERIHVHRQACEMHRHDGFGTRRYRGCRFGDIDVTGGEIDIHEYRFRTQPHYHVSGRGKGHRRNNHFIAGADVTHLQRHFQRAGGRGEGAHRTSAHIGA